MPQQIKLTGGHIATIDDIDLDTTHTVEFSAGLTWTGKIGSVAWRGVVRNHTTYATAILKSSIELRLHRVIVNAKAGQLVDHRDHNGLNNCRDNLRIVTPSENSINRLPNIGKRFKGVAPHKASGKFEAYLKTGRIKKHIGLYGTEEEAAAAYNTEARKHWGEMAVLNPVQAN